MATTATKTTLPSFAWIPQEGPQLHAIAARFIKLLFFGGARGGGKSDFLLGDFLQDVDRYKSYWRGVIFRRSFPELEQLIARSKEIYPQTGAEWSEGKKTWTWPNGATLKFRHLEREADAEKYQGHAYTWIGFDELPNWPNLKSFFKLMGCLRSAHGVPCRMRATGNPGGPGHNAVKSYFIDPAPTGYTEIADEETGDLRMFIPSRVTDNKYLGTDYINTLKQVGSESLVRAWLDGDWNAVLGAYFDTFSAQLHVITPLVLPQYWLKFRSFDWGGSSPFSVGWHAVSDGDPVRNIKGAEKVYPKNSLIRYREWYGASKPNVGLKLNNLDIAAGILAREDEHEKISYSVADPAIFIESGGPSIAETFARAGVVFRPGDNRRINGWAQFRDRLLGIDGKPLYYVYNTCVDFIRTIPTLQHSEARPEDLDTEAEDHIADEVRYGCMSRPYTREKPAPAKNIEQATLSNLTFNEFMSLESQRTKQRERI